MRNFLRSASIWITVASAVLVSLSGFLRADIEGEGEVFTVFFDNYFVERQGGQAVSLVVEYQFLDRPSREAMPDYRAIQILIEDLLYESGDPHLYWELVNRELVRRLLAAHPQFSTVRSQFTVSPLRELTLYRHSRVRYGRDALDWLGDSVDFRNDVYYQLPEGREVVLVPRPFKAWYDEHRAAFEQDRSALDLSCTQLNGSESVLGSLVAMVGNGSPWTGIVLPRQLEHFPLKQGPSVGNLGGLVIIHHPEITTGEVVIESGLASLLGTLATGMSTGTLAETRRDFFLNNRYRAMITTHAASGLYQNLGWTTEPFAEENELYLYSRE